VVDPVSFDPGADALEVLQGIAEQENKTRALLEEILKVLLRIEKHWEIATDEEMENDVH
jgi:mannitol/fructose-specific phosphotransferase system IIA component